MNIRDQRARGDTIIEVLISLAILAVVLGTAYASTTRSLHFGLNAQQRDQALLIGQQQVELLKNADAAGTVSTYQVNRNFCINPDQTLREVNVYSQSCPVGSGAQFEIVDKWISASKTFSITLYWQNQNAALNQVILHYKTSNSYIP